jgi:hypothetical protein
MGTKAVSHLHWYQKNWLIAQYVMLLAWVMYPFLLIPQCLYFTQIQNHKGQLLMTGLCMARSFLDLFKSITEGIPTKYCPLHESYSISVMMAIDFQSVSEVVDTNMVQSYTCWQKLVVCYCTSWRHSILPWQNLNIKKDDGKVTLLQAWCGPEGG